jgi:hypothetical protein
MIVLKTIRGLSPTYALSIHIFYNQYESHETVHLNLKKIRSHLSYRESVCRD